jgi:probable phosphoglycerate mutase
MPQELVIVRHGETEWSREGRHTGRTDIPLTANGVRQAQRLALLLRRWHFTAVYCSPLQRARDTCALAGYSSDAILDPDLQEWDYGEYDGKTLADIREQRPEWVLWRDGVVGGETLAEVAARVQRVITRVRAVHGDVLLIAHGHILRVLTARWLDMEPAEGAHFRLGPAAPAVLGYEHEWTALRAWGLEPS